MRLLSLFMFLECAELTEQREEQIFGGIIPDLDGIYENQEEEVVAMIEEGSGIATYRPGISMHEDVYTF